MKVNFRGGREILRRCKQGVNALGPLLKPPPKATGDLIKLSIMGFKSKRDTFMVV